MLMKVFQNNKPVLGKVQLLALPGSPHWDGNWDALVSRAEQEAAALATGGVDGLVLENFYDTPYSVAAMDVAGAIAMAFLVRRIQEFTHLPVGISIREHDPETALAIAVNTQASFIRLSLLTGAMVSESGVINSRYAQLVEYKNRLKAKLPLLMVNVASPQLGLPLLPESDFGKQPGHSPLELLQTVIHSIEKTREQCALILDSATISPSVLLQLKSMTDLPLLVEQTGDACDIEPYFNGAAGLILDAGIRKAGAYHDNTLLPTLSPTIDVSRVEELVNRLRKVPAVHEMPAEIFLTRY